MAGAQWGIFVMVWWAWVGFGQGSASTRWCGTERRGEWNRQQIGKQCKSEREPGDRGSSRW